MIYGIYGGLISAQKQSKIAYPKSKKPNLQEIKILFRYDSESESIYQFDTIGGDVGGGVVVVVVVVDGV